MRQIITQDIILNTQSKQASGVQQKKSFLQKANGILLSGSLLKSNSYKSQQQSKSLQFLSYYSPNQIDCYVREVFKKFIQIPVIQYVDSTLGFYFESIYVNHRKECDSAECFCNEYKQAYDLKKDDFISSDKRERFITGYINYVFSTYFYHYKNLYQFDVNRLRFSYLTLLIQVCQIPIKAYVEVISLGKFDKNASKREQFVYHSILRKAQKMFQKYFVNSSLNNQKLQMIQVIEFNEIVQNTTILIFKALQKKYEFYQYLSQDFLNLNELNKLGKLNIKIRNQIEYNILQIFDFEPLQQKGSLPC
ncbi:hypothetical protein ABPG72_015135 [Tetrahymena utriculariae]